MIFGGNLAAVLLYAVVLGFCVEAFGHHLALADLILTYAVVTIFAGFMPVPGGMGVAEARLHGRARRARAAPHRRAVDRDDVPARHLLPAADLGRLRDGLAPPPRVRLSPGPGTPRTG